MTKYFRKTPFLAPFCNPMAPNFLFKIKSLFLVNFNPLSVDKVKHGSEFIFLFYNSETNLLLLSSDLTPKVIIA